MAVTPRPRVVTMACVFVGFSAFLLLLDLIQALSNWGTIETQDGLKPALDGGRGRPALMSRWASGSAPCAGSGWACVLLACAAIVFAVYASEVTSASRSARRRSVVTGLLIVPFGWLGLAQALFLLFCRHHAVVSDAWRWLGPPGAVGRGARAGRPEVPAKLGRVAQSEADCRNSCPHLRTTYRPESRPGRGPCH